MPTLPFLDILLALSASVSVALAMRAARNAAKLDSIAALLAKRYTIDGRRQELASASESIRSQVEEYLAYEETAKHAIERAVNHHIELSRSKHMADFIVNLAGKRVAFEIKTYPLGVTASYLKNLSELSEADALVLITPEPIPSSRAEKLRSMLPPEIVFASGFDEDTVTQNIKSVLPDGIVTE